MVWGHTKQKNDNSLHIFKVMTPLVNSHKILITTYLVCFMTDSLSLDWLESLKQFFIIVSYILVASLSLMALFLNRAIRDRLATSI